MIVLLPGCKAFRGAEPKVLERMSGERHAIAETCSALKTADPGDGEHSLSETGRRVLRGDPRDTARTLVRMAATTALAEAGRSSVPSPPDGCRPPDIDAIFAAAPRTFSPEQVGQLETCSTYYFEALPSAIGATATDQTLAWLKLARAVRNRGLAAKDVLRDPAALAEIIDLSPHVTDAVARLAYVLHERIESLTASIPYAGGLVGVAIELIGAELLAASLDAIVRELEAGSTTKWVNRADVSRRACELVEARTDHPAIVHRTLVRLILRFRYDQVSIPRHDFTHGVTAEGAYSAAAFCDLDQSARRRRLCRRIARRHGVKLGGDEADSPRVGVKISDLPPRFEAVTLAGAQATRPKLPGVDRDLSRKEITAQTTVMTKALISATATCADVETCTLEAINRQLILFEGDGKYKVHLHSGRQEEPCVRCCPSCAQSPLADSSPPPPTRVRFEKPRSVVDIVVAIDRSGSMRNAVDAGALAEAVQKLQDDTHAVLEIGQSDAVRFGPKCRKIPTVVLAPKHELWEEVETISRAPDLRGQGTPLVTTLGRVLERLAQLRTDAQRVVIVVSDGQSTCLKGNQETTVKLRQMLNAAADSGVQVAFVQLPTERDDPRVDLGDHCGHDAMLCVSANGDIPAAIAKGLRGATCMVTLPRAGPEHASMVVNETPHLQGWRYVNRGRTRVRMEAPLCEAVELAGGGALVEVSLPSSVVGSAAPSVDG